MPPAVSAEAGALPEGKGAAASVAADDGAAASVAADDGAAASVAADDGAAASVAADDGAAASVAADDGAVVPDDVVVPSGEGSSSLGSATCPDRMLGVGESLSTNDVPVEADGGVSTAGATSRGSASSAAVVRPAVTTADTHLPCPVAIEIPPNGFDGPSSASYH